MVVRYINKGPVGYTVVGSPTIVDGVASGFDYQNYLKTTLPLSPTTNDNFEVVLDINTKDINGDQTIFLSRHGSSSSQRFGFRLGHSSSGSSRTFFVNPGIEDSWNTVMRSTTTVLPNTEYKLKVTYENMVMKFYIDSGSGFVEENSMSDITPMSFYKTMIGTTDYTSGYQFKGSINLNQSYIKVNGQLWFGEVVFIPKNQLKTSAASSEVLLNGEPVYEETTNSMKVGNGVDVYDELPYLVDNSGEWRKPKDWVDIRSGALDNSVYYLVAHSIPTLSEGSYSITDYPKWGILATVTTSGNTYDVYVDGAKIATTASGTSTIIDWESLYTAGTIVSGYNVTTPGAFVTHIIRVTPTVATDKIEKICSGNISGQAMQGTFWVHFETDNFINTRALLGYSNTTSQNRLCRAITAKNDELKVKITTNSNTSGLAYLSMGLGPGSSNTTFEYLPTLVGDNLITNTYAYEFAVRFPAKIKKLRLKNISIDYANLSNFCGEEIITDVPVRMCSGDNSDSWFGSYTEGNLKRLKRFPPSTFLNATRTSFYATGMPNLEPAVFDFSPKKDMTRLVLGGNNALQARGVKGVTVSNEAPFGGTSPQLWVNYTGLDRAALVNLFKSMPYNVGYEVVGSPTIVDGVASGFSASDYATTSVISPKQTEFNSIEIGTRIIAPSTFSADSIFLGVAGIRMENDSNGGISVIGLGAGPLATGINIASSDIYLKLIADTSSTKVYTSADGDSFTEVVNTTTYHLTDSISTKVAFGYWSDSAFPGSIDLAHTYINIDGIQWFKGTAAMTKTCSIVGCTGTADLTADDKSIAEDKGWELVLS